VKANLKILLSFPQMSPPHRPQPPPTFLRRSKHVEASMSNYVDCRLNPTASLPSSRSRQIPCQYSRRPESGLGKAGQYRFLRSSDLFQRSVRPPILHLSLSTISGDGINYSSFSYTLFFFSRAFHFFFSFDLCLDFC